MSECLVEAATALGYPIVYPRELLARKAGAMKKLTQAMGSQLQELGAALSQAVTSAQKVRLAGEINRFASEDLGGVTFMSDDIHEVMGGVGAIPGTTGCLSLFVPAEELERTVYPTLTLEDVNRFADVILAAVGQLALRREDAWKEVIAAGARASGHSLAV